MFKLRAGYVELNSGAADPIIGLINLPVILVPCMFYLYITGYWWHVQQHFKTRRYPRWICQKVFWAIAGSLSICSTSCS